MKKILLIIAISLLTIPIFSQGGMGWVQQRVKNQFRDSVYFYKDANFNGTLRLGEGNLRIGGVPITPDGTEINILNGLLSNTTELNRLVGVTSGVQGQLDGKAPLANPNFTTAVRLAGDSLMTKTRTEAISAAAVETRVASARNLGDYAFLKSTADAPGGAMTYEGVVNYVAANGGGGTGTGGYEWTEFIIGTTTGAPANGDTAFTISQMAGDVIELYKGTTADLHKQWLNETATNGRTGYRYNSSGQIVVRPAWATNDRAYVKAVPSSAIAKITLPGGASTLTTGLYAYWKFENNVEDTFASFEGTATDITYVTGISGSAASFNGSTSKVVIGNVIKPTAALSFSIWTKDAGMPTSRIIIGHSLYTTAWQGWRMERYNDNGSGVMMADGAGINFDQPFGTNFSNNAWHHTVFTWDGTTAYIYKDGVKSPGYTWPYTIGYALTHNLTIGANEVGGQVYDGEIDEVRIYNRALTDAEANQLFHEFD